jgi:hypothetical protein
VRNSCQQRLNPFDVEGFWTGHCFTKSGIGHPWTRGLVEITIHGGADNRGFYGRGYDLDHVLLITGCLQHDNESLEFTITKEFSDNFYSDPIWCVAKFDESSRTILGEWGLTKGSNSGPLRLCQIPAIFHRFRPSNDKYAKNRARAHWQFALTAVLHQVKRNMWSWSYFQSRFAERRRFVNLLQRREWSWRYLLPRKLTENETKEISWFEQYLSHADFHFYTCIAATQWRKLLIHRLVTI